MKTAKKQRRGRLISARREVAEQNRIRNGYERNLAKQLVTVFNRIGRRAGEQYQQGGLRTINRNQNTQDLAAVIIPSVRATMTAMIDRFQLISPKQSPYERFIEQYINTQVGSHIQNIEATTMNQIRKAILEGTEQDLGPEPISRLIRGRVGGEIGRRRAITIARTETHSAASYANNAVAKESGVNLKKRWVSTNDERTREHHRAVNGQEVGMDEDFIVPYKGVDYAMGFAGDPRGGPANVINCRCVIVYFEDEDVIIDDPVTEPVREPDFVPPEVVDEPVIPEKPKIDISPVFGGLKTRSQGAAKYNDVLNNALTDVTARVVASLQLPNQIRETKGKSSYQSGEYIKSSTEYGTFEHEYGHYVDYRLGRQGGNSFDYWSEKGLINEFRADRKTLELDNETKRDAVLTKLKAELFKGDGSRNVPKFEGATEISDIVDAMVSGYFRRFYGTWGHSVSYWRRSGSKQRETFANLFSLQNKPEALAFVKKYFPELQEKFETSMQEFADQFDLRKKGDRA